MDKTLAKTSGMSLMTARAEQRNREEAQQLALRIKATNMRRRMSAMREGVYRKTHRATKSAAKINDKI